MADLLSGPSTYSLYYRLIPYTPKASTLRSKYILVAGQHQPLQPHTARYRTLHRSALARWTRHWASAAETRGLRVNPYLLPQSAHTVNRCSQNNRHINAANQ